MASSRKCWHLATQALRVRVGVGEQRGARAFASAAGLAAARGPMRIAIVGSGPAGMYTARTLLRKVENVEVDILEMLPTPFGLVRYGVAPDHADTKNVTTEFSQILSAPNCSFYGNVVVGKDVSVDELLGMYHGVVLAYGAEGDRSLGIPGENLKGSLSARDFVNWYNGHPFYANFAPNLTAGEDAVIIGNGNVAIDVARVLLKPLDALSTTDIADHALEALSSSTISRVHVVGRRGPVQAAFTIAELREIVNLKNINVFTKNNELLLDDVDEQILTKKRPLKRMVSLLQDTAASPHNPLVKKELHLRFLQSPTEVVPSAQAPGQVGSLTLQANRLEGDADSRRPVRVGTSENMPCSLLMRSVGYRSVPMEGVPFDIKTHTVPQAGGAVVTANQLVRGLYVTGWLKRGPSGIIGTNISDAQQTATSIIIDWESHKLDGVREGGGAMASLFKSRNVRAVNVEEWQKIDKAEVERGTADGRPRRKFVTISEMMQLLS